MINDLVDLEIEKYRRIGMAPANYEPLAWRDVHEKMHSQQVEDTLFR